MDAQLPGKLVFAPELVSKTIGSNGLEMEFANSFLIFSNRSNLSLLEEKSLAWHYSTARKKEYCVSTEFRSTNSIETSVHKRYISDHREESIFKHNLADETRYLTGNSLKQKFDKLFSLNHWKISDMKELYQEYLGFALSFSDKKNLDGFELLPGDLIDMIPRNIIVSNSGELQIFDQEWESRNEIDVRYLIFRSVVSLTAITVFGKDENSVEHSISSLLNLVYDELGLRIEPDDLVEFKLAEYQLQDQVSGLGISFAEFDKNFDLKLGRVRFDASLGRDYFAERDGAIAERDGAIAERDGAIAERDGAIAERDGAIAERDVIKGSRIWRAFKFYRLLRRRS
jgi:hypothetical protein